MEKLKALYESQEDIPESFRDLYEERGGQFHLTQIEGIKTDADLSRVNRALSQEREEKRKFKEQYEGILNGRSAEDLQAMLDKYPELEAAADGKVDEDKLNELAEARLRTKLAPLEREKGQLASSLEEAQQKIQQFEEKERIRSIHDTVRGAASKSKVIDTAMEDVLMLAERMLEVTEDGDIVTKENVGVTPGIAAEVWLTEMQAKRPHWWPSSGGGGARGTAGNRGFAQNPWAHDTWNMTEQGRMYRENPEKAKQMAESAGTSIGGQKPAPKQ